MARNEKPDRRPSRENRTPAYIAWHVAGNEEKAFWTRIGAAWSHQDGEGLTLQLDLVPVSGGRIVLRHPSDERNNKGAGA